jgi:adenylate kinase family enzyme
MLICFEGPSAVGKTTMCAALQSDFFIIPEVNLLYKRPKAAHKYWYYEKQMARFQLAKKVSKNAIFDGDTLQPFWYNWSYDFPKEYPNLEETTQFYLKEITANNFEFPDLYIVFTISESELIKRKENDSTRRRGGFNKHLRLLDTQKQYFEFLKKETDLAIVFIENKDF